MKKRASWLSRHASFALALSGAFLFFGVTMACPASGLIATLPLSFCLFLAAAWIRPGVVFQALLTPVLSLAYGFGLGVASPFVFAGETLLGALAACGCVALIRRASGKKALFIPAALLLALGIALPLTVYGTPASYLAARQNARAYLAARYPDQVFTRVSGYRDPLAKAWHCDCSYEYEGHVLSSVVLFGESVSDGFLEDRMAVALEPRRSVFIEALRAAEEPVLVEPDGYSAALIARESVPGVYGEYDPDLEGEMRFSITFRREKTQKRDFALAIRDVMALLGDRALKYDQIRFVALSAGEPVYECTVTPDTAPEELMDLIERV